MFFSGCRASRNLTVPCKTFQPAILHSSSAPPLQAPTHLPKSHPGDAPLFNVHRQSLPSSCCCSYSFNLAQPWSDASPEMDGSQHPSDHIMAAWCWSNSMVLALLGLAMHGSCSSMVLALLGTCSACLHCWWLHAACSTIEGSHDCRTLKDISNPPMGIAGLSPPGMSAMVNSACSIKILRSQHLA